MTREENDAVYTRLEERRRAGDRVVFTNGCFDLLHVGHVRYLAEARKLGDLLVVGLNSDSSVRQLKGASRPFTSENDRKELLLALRAVDYVLIFDEDTPQQLISKVLPDVLVKGGDWAVKDIVGSDIVKARGGEVHSLPFSAGYSTTAIVDKIAAQVKAGE